MRNLAEFPITKQEVLDCLNRLLSRSIEENRGQIPDMESVFISEAIKIVKESDHK